MSRRYLVPAAGVPVLAALAVLAVYAYFFSGLRSAPAPLALSTPTPGASASPPASGDLSGAWKVASGSQAEWRVKELFAGESSQHGAVGRTTAVSGDLTVSGQEVSSFSFSADLSQLASVDTVFGHDVRQRDQVVRQALGTGQFPLATFKSSQAVAVPAGLAAGQQVQLQVPGQLTIHGVTEDVTATVTVQLSGTQVEAAGSIPTDMQSFNIQAPRAPFVTVDPNVTIGFVINLSKS
jgi:polyisoprenoid-binding protein YceI